MHQNIKSVVDGIYWNGREVSDEAAKAQEVGPFADPIRFVSLK